MPGVKTAPPAAAAAATAAAAAAAGSPPPMQVTPSFSCSACKDVPGPVRSAPALLFCAGSGVSSVDEGDARVVLFALPGVTMEVLPQRAAAESAAGLFLPDCGVLADGVVAMFSMFRVRVTWPGVVFFALLRRAREVCRSYGGK